MRRKRQPKPGIKVNINEALSWFLAMMGYGILLWVAIGALVLCLDYLL